MKLGMNAMPLEATSVFVIFYCLTVPVLTEHHAMKAYWGVEV